MCTGDPERADGRLSDRSDPEYSAIRLLRTAPYAGRAETCSFVEKTTPIRTKTINA
jgi:hypothetical protein